MEFVTHKISEIGTLVVGGDKPQKCAPFPTEECSVPIYSNGIVNSGLYGYTDKARIYDKCITISARGTVGAVFHRTEPFFPIVRLISLIPDTSIIDESYLYYFFKSFPLEGFGTSQQQITTPYLGKKKVRFIKDVLTQSKIASILSAYDSLIECNSKRIRLLEQMAENLYKEWFVRFRFPGHQNVKMKDGLPEGWEKGEISHFYNTCSGGTPSRSKEEYYENGTIPWLKTGEIQDSIIVDTEEYITEDAVKHSSAKLLPAKSVVMAMYGVNIGKLAYLNKEMTCNQACCVFFDKRKTSSRHYLFHYLYSIRDYLLLIGFGVAQQNLSQDLIRNIRITIPPDSILEAFETKVELIYNEILSLKKQSALLTRQRDLLLPRLMSGKLEVKPE